MPPVRRSPSSPRPTTAQRPAAVTLVDEDDWPGAIAASVLMAAPVRAPILISDADGIPDVTSEALAELDPQGSDVDRRRRGLRDRRRRARRTGVDRGGSRPRARAGDRRRDPAPARPALRRPAAPHRRRPARRAGLRDARRRLGGALRRPGPLRRPRQAAEGDGRGAARTRQGPGLRPRPLLGDLLRRRSARSARSPAGSSASPARTRSRTRSPSPATRTATSAGTSTTPATASSIARCDEPLVAAAVSPLSASGTWGPLLLTDGADTLPAALRAYLLDVKPGYTEDPTRAFYNHVWVIGDQEAIEVGEQAEIDSLAELAKIGGEG